MRAGSIGHRRRRRWRNRFENDTRYDIWRYEECVRQGWRGRRTLETGQREDVVRNYRDAEGHEACPSANARHSDCISLQTYTLVARGMPAFTVKLLAQIRQVNDASAVKIPWCGDRTTSTGMVLCVSTLTASLPSTIAEIPRRPCEAMTIRSHDFRAAVSMMAR